MSKQNIYDNDLFYENFEKIRNEEINFNDIIETPIILGMFLTTAVVNDFIQEYPPLRIKPNADCHIIGDTWKSGKVLHNTCEARKDDLGKRLHFFICRQQIRDHDRVQAAGMCCTDSIV